MAAGYQVVIPNATTVEVFDAIDVDPFGAWTIRLVADGADSIHVVAEEVGVLGVQLSRLGTFVPSGGYPSVTLHTHNDRLYLRNTRTGTGSLVVQVLAES